VGIPHVAIALNRVKKKTPEKKGVKGELPLGCFPLWGREGITARNCQENICDLLKKRD
jgi:hypothetical protein